MKAFKWLPNVLTLTNLFGGLMVIIASFNSNFNAALYWVAACLVLDFLDGTVARLLNAQSDLGLQLDSLADAVSFGVAPGLLLYNYYAEYVESPLHYVCLLLPLFAVLRLAIFNTRQQFKDFFTGLPTPAMSLAAFSIPVAGNYFDASHAWVSSPIFMVAFCLIASSLMVSNFKMFSLKTGSKNTFLNSLRLGIVALGVILFIWLKFFGIILCLIIYIIISLTFQNRFQTA